MAKRKFTHQIHHSFRDELAKSGTPSQWRYGEMWVEAWVINTIDLYYHNDQQYAGLTLGEFLFKMRPVSHFEKGA